MADCIDTSLLIAAVSQATGRHLHFRSKGLQCLPDPAPGHIWAFWDPAIYGFTPGGCDICVQPGQEEAVLP